MKINNEDFSSLKTAILGVIGNRNAVELAAGYKAQGLSDKRFRWDLLWAVPNIVRQPIFDRMYKYAHDEHIDTALRRIVKEIS